MNLNFNLQLELSDILNLVEHLKFLKDIIDYGLLKMEDNLDKMLLINSDHIQKETTNNLDYHKTEIKNFIENIKNADFAELRAIKAPPSGIQNVAEAMCYLFAKPASYQNFVRLINSPNFINQLKQFDLSLINDYKLKHIKQYVDMTDFNPEYLAKISKTASTLCHFIQCVYYYCTSSASESVINLLIF